MSILSPRTRDVFLVVKEQGAVPEWVEQDDFGKLPNYDQWLSLERRAIPADLSLEEFARQA